MSRIMKVLVALVAIAAVAAPAIAEDRLSLSGQMRVRAFYGSQDIEGIDGSDESHAWNDQRLRIGGKVAVAEGVSVNFRFDASESDENSSNDVAWGGSTSTSFAPYSHRRADIQFDKAYLQLEKNGYTLMAGQMYFGGFGTGHLLDTVGTGFIVKRGPVYLAHIKQYDENNGNDSFAKSNADDETTLTAASFDFKNDDFSIKPMVSYASRESSDGDRLGLGVYGTANLGVIALKGEIDYFNGETDGGTDEKGFQVYLDGSTALSETVTLGLIGLYAQGQDDDIQVTYQAMPVFAEWHPENYGPWSTEFTQEFDTFDPTGVGAGVLGIELYTNVKLSDDLGLQASATYLETEDDDVADADGYVLNGSLAYALATNTSLTGHLNYSDIDVEGTSVETLQSIAGLVVKF